MTRVAGDAADAAPVVVDTDLGGSALSLALRGGTAPAAWQAPAPATSAEWQERARQAAARCPGWLSRLRPAFGSGAHLLDRVAESGVVITTGQQPGLFGGPLYTWFKALTALEMARAHEAATGIPSVPVFWAATDDADFTEAASTVVPGDRGAEQLTLRSRPDTDGVPLAFVTLGEEIEALRATLAARSGSAADPRPLRAAAAFAPGRSIGEAYVAMLRELLEPLGIAVLDAAHPSVGDASRTFLRSALERAGPVHAALHARGEEILAAGFSLPVDTDRDLSLVFAWEGSEALPVKRRLTLAESHLGVPNGRLSPNVLLRPITEAQLLPTVAYVAGPGELAYFAQVSAVAEALDVPVPLALPRWSGRIVPLDVLVLLQQQGWDAEQLRDPHAAEGTIARAALPPAAAEGIRTLRVAIDREIGRLEGVLSAAAVAGAKGDLGRRLDRAERRALAAIKRREADLLGQVGRARGLLFPNGVPQERALNLVPLWARSGEVLLGALRGAARAHATRWWPAGE